MSQSDQIDWTTYYNARSGRPPRPLLLNALGRFHDDPSGPPRQAIDLGCGEGSDSLALLQRGWHVLAIDREPEAIARLRANVPEALQPQLQTTIAAFEEVALPTADLIYASYSLPFCEPAHFTSLWHKIETAVCKGGRFVGQLFGDRDTWTTNGQMTFLTERETHALFTNFTLEFIQEIDEDGQAVSGPKHWHYFDIIARKEGLNDSGFPFPRMA